MFFLSHQVLIMAATVSDEPMAASASVSNIYCQAPSCGQAVAKELKCGSCLSVIYCSKSALCVGSFLLIFVLGFSPFLSQLFCLIHWWL
jgi:hypothetical protein